MKAQQLRHLLQTLNLKNKAPDENAWSQIKTELSTLVDAHLEEHDLLKKTFDLAYQEMQNMLEFVAQRELLSKSIFNASLDIILTLDQYGQVIDYNQSLERILQINGLSIIGKKLIDSIPDCIFIKELEDALSDTTENDEKSIFGKSYESALCDTAGFEIPIMVSINRIQLRENIFYPLYIKDLTNEKAAARELEESRSQLILTSKMSALGEMAGGVAHEINTPLAVIQMRADQLLEYIEEGSLTNETLVSSLHAIENTVKRIAKIISGLRSFARDGRKDPMVLTSIAKIIDDTFSLCREKFNSHGVRLEFNPIPDFEVECRPGEISQVILNLLNNSYDAIETISDKWVKIELDKIANLIFIRITDCGLGIPTDVQKKIMQPFFTTKDIGKGTGLGLSISKGLIESHGGNLQIDSTHTNTSFMIILPVHQKKN